MKSFLTLALVLFCSLTAYAEGPAIFSGSFTKLIPSQLNLGGAAYVLTGSADPSAVATTAPAGSIYLRTNGSVYAKQDSGSSTNWSVFSVGSSAITALTGEVTASGPGSAAATLSNAAVIGKVLTGYVSSAGTVAATDTILQAVQKLNGNTAANTTSITQLQTDADPSTTVGFVEEFQENSPSQGAGLGPAGYVYTVVGTGASFLNAGGLLDAGHPGVGRLSTGTTTTGLAGVYGGQAYVFGGGAMTFEALINLSALSNGTDTYAIDIGFGDSQGGSYTNGVWLSYSSAVNSGNWVGKTSSASVVSTVNSAVAPVANTWTKVKLVVNAAGTNADYYVNGVLFGSLTTNIPTTFATQAMYPITRILKSAGTTSVTLRVDYWKLKQVLTTPR